MIIGVTGSFGSGKTAVAGMFKRLGAYVIDADEVCRSLTAPGKGVYEKVVRCFGGSILKKDMAIDRKKLGNIVFKKKTDLSKLNKIIHPEAIKVFEEMVRASKNRLVIIDAALLVESGYYKKTDRLIVVRTNKDRQVKRIMRAKGMKRSDVLRMIGMQAPLKKKLALADFIIDNSGSKKQTLFQVKRIWKQLGGSI